MKTRYHELILNDLVTAIDATRDALDMALAQRDRILAIRMLAEVNSLAAAADLVLQQKRLTHPNARIQ